MVKKRQNYISWNTYFMANAIMASFRSKDPSTINGACVVDPKTNTIISSGYNGFVRGCSDDVFPWKREGDNTKYPYVECAERNAIYNAHRDLEGAEMYLYSEKGYLPCCHCARGIIQTGIKKVFVLFKILDKIDKWDFSQSIKMFNAAGVTIEDLSLNEDFFKHFECFFNRIEEFKTVFKNIYLRDVSQAALV